MASDLFFVLVFLLLVPLMVVARVLGAGIVLVFMAGILWVGWVTGA